MNQYKDLNQQNNKTGLLDRALLSNIDIDNNNVYTVDAVEKSSQKW